ncbi:MAG: ABC transporter permease [Acidobacteriia bacterium]|nr:ABC transporter permease [Terriglobia bacterium]
MRTSTLLARNLAWYWRTNLAALLGVAVATGVLGGALLVGESVRASLRALALERLGNADFAVTRSGFFRGELAEALAPSSPVIALEGVVIHEASSKRATGVQIYGVDERFWKFQGAPGKPPRGREIQFTPALAQELGATANDDILLRLPKPSAIPLETLHGRKDDTGRTIRLSMSGVAAREFSLRPQQGELRAAYVPLARLQMDLSQRHQVNTILVAGGSGLESKLKQRYALADLGLRLRVLEKPGCLSLESDSALISDALATAASSAAGWLGLRTQPVLTYLANSIRAGGRATPYSVVTALDSALAPAAEDGIVLNDWAARDLGAKPRDPVELDYYVWRSDGRLHAETARFRLERVVPLTGEASDPDLAPAYPGITESRSLRDWDPPFPLDLSRIRPVDEQYWDRHRATPKAFIRLERGRRLWGTRFGSLTSIRVFPPSPAFGEALRATLEPAQMGLAVTPVKAQALEAARGATDFGEYFTYFSFFLMFSALLLTGLFFRLGIEQRMKEIGVLRSLGFSASKIRTVFLLEGAALSAAGAAAGAAAELGYGALILLGLRTWWFDAVGTKLLSLHASFPALAGAVAAGVITGLGSVAWTLRGLQPETPRHLVKGGRRSGTGPWRRRAGALCALLSAGFVAAAFAGRLDPAAAFFGAGALLLIAALLFLSAWLYAPGAALIRGPFTLGLRSLAYRPGRSILCIALMASATFLIVSLDAFRRDDSSARTGEYPLLADSALPLIHDPNTPAGRAALNLPPLDGVRFVPFRVRPGDDASCLNLYLPRNPRILAPPAGFAWPLLESKVPGGAIPAIADANSLTYSLHRKVGEEFEAGGVRYRIVSALQNSLFQGELLISGQNFLRLFPDSEGYRFFLLSVPAGKEEEVTRILEESLSDYGFDVQPAQARLAAFHRVENTYLSTFRALGGLGLVLGAVGLAAVLMRNVLERRKELALLRAVGYRPQDLAAIVIAENAALLLIGLAAGAGCAAVAVAPAVHLRGGHLPVASLAALLALVLATGIASSLVATAATLRSPLLDALRSE